MNKKDRSPVDWYLVSVLLQFEEDGIEPSSHDGYRHVWENTYLVKASHPIVAFDKGTKLGRGDQESITFKGKPGRWCFVGIKEVLPIYEKLQDGSEIMWTDWGKQNYQETNKKVLSKSEFEDKLAQKT